MAKIDREHVHAVLAGHVPRVLAAADYFGDDLPDYFDAAAGRWYVNGFWTEGFWPGLLWRLYDYSRDSRLAVEARRTTRIVAALKAEVDDHDLGFLFFPSCVHEFEATGDEEMLAPALAAAQRLAGRFIPSGKFISAHGPLDGPKAGFAILDTVMNLRLLFWAAGRTGERRLAELASAVAYTAARQHVRPNGSSCQVLWFDVVNGEVVRRDAVMAVGVDSCWARAQAWGIRGFAEVYQDTGDNEFGRVAERMMRYFESRLPSDGVVFHDLDDPMIPAVPRDTSAQAIAAGGVLILAECTTGQERATLVGQAAKWLAPLLERCLVPAVLEARSPRGLLGQGCKSVRKNQGLVSEIVFGDYYLVDALIRWLRLAG
jgi:unsaturated chondroitin disaccharide hydrolase